MRRTCQQVDLHTDPLDEDLLKPGTSAKEDLLATSHSSSAARDEYIAMRMLYLAGKKLHPKPSLSASTSGSRASKRSSSRSQSALKSPSKSLVKKPRLRSNSSVASPSQSQANTR